VNTLEILPPLGRPKSKIVEVEMPYSTKLLTQEQETYLNLAMRYITTSGVERLKPLEFSGTSSEVVKELPRLILPETSVPAYIEDVPQAVLTVEQLRSMGAQLATMTEAERAVLDTVLEEGGEEGRDLEQQAQMDAMAGLAAAPKNEIVVPREGEGVVAAVPQTFGGMPIQPEAQIITPGLPRQEFMSEGYITGAQVPSGGRIIAVRTDPAAMMADGIPMGGFDMPRQVRRNPYRSFGGMGQMPPMMPQASRYTPMEGGNGMGSSMPSSGPIKINKIE
jgi:hypothetical protein